MRARLERDREGSAGVSGRPGIQMAARLEGRLSPTDGKEQARAGSSAKQEASQIGSSESAQAAAAHEISHYYRWKDGTELNEDALTNIDEALTSLDAITRFQNYYRKVAVQRGYERESAQNCLLLMVEEVGEGVR